MTNLLTCLKHIKANGPMEESEGICGNMLLVADELQLPQQMMLARELDGMLPDWPDDEDKLSGRGQPRLLESGPRAHIVAKPSPHCTARLADRGVRKMKLKEHMLKLLLKAIKDSNLTQTAIAKQAGVGPSEISRIVNGKLEPSTEYCIRILSSLGYSVKVQEGGQIVVQKNG